MRLLLIAALVIVTACSQGGGQTGSSSPAPGVTGIPTRQDAKIGEPVSKDGITLTVLKVVPANQENQENKNGQWIEVWMTVANDTEQPYDFSNYSLSIRDDNGHTFGAYICCFNDPPVGGPGPILAHDKVTGAVYFDVPSSHLKLLWATKPTYIDLGTP